MSDNFRYNPKDPSDARHTREGLRMLVETQFGSTSMLQRKLGIGFTKAAGIMTHLEALGVVGPSKGTQARPVHYRPEDVETALALLEPEPNPEPGPGPDAFGQMTAAVAATVRHQARGALTVMIGAPGSGKTTWATARHRAEDLLSLDTMRIAHFGSAEDQSHNDELMPAFRAELDARLARGEHVVVDNTSTLPAHRTELLAAAATHGAPARAVVMRTPLEECLRRNASRDRQVPEDIIALKHASAAEATEDVLANEGFTTITFIC